MDQGTEAQGLPLNDFVGSTDPRLLQVHRPPGRRDVPYVPTDDAVVEAMLDLAGVGPTDTLYDLGCGDGRIPVAAARRGAHAVGVDIDLQRVHESYDNVKRAGVRDRVKVLRASFFDVDLRPASVVTLYLLPSLNVKLRPKLLWELRPGARIVSNNFESDGWTPDEQVLFRHRNLYLWIVPAWVQGRWKCTIDDPAGREHLTLDLRRDFQKLHGTARVGRHEVEITDGKIRGDYLRFTVFHPLYVRPARHFTGRAEGGFLRGTCHTSLDDVHRVPWGAVRL